MLRRKLRQIYLLGLVFTFFPQQDPENLLANEERAAETGNHPANHPEEKEGSGILEKHPEGTSDKTSVII